jgi:ABC-2 type transport system permease protein
MAWGLIGGAASFALSLARERRAGVFLRLRAAPLSRLDLLLGKAAACWLVCIGELLLLLLLAAFFVGIRPVDALGAPMAFAAAAMCFVGLMMLASQFGRDEVAIAGSTWAVMLVFALFGGAIMPFSLMPEWMQTIGQASPARWAVQALEGALWRGQGWRELARPCAALAATGIAAFALGAALFCRRAR